jgi:hypothetical protein
MAAWVWPHAPEAHHGMPINTDWPVFSFSKQKGVVKDKMERKRMNEPLKTIPSCIFTSVKRQQSYVLIINNAAQMVQPANPLCCTELQPAVPFIPKTPDKGVLYVLRITPTAQATTVG